MKLEYQNLKTQPILYQKSLAVIENKRLPVREGDTILPSLSGVDDEALVKLELQTMSPWDQAYDYYMMHRC